MPLEATMLVLDNSEWMRNGDFTPTRWDAQSDAVNILFDAKTNSNPENMVGVMTMAGKSPEVLVTLTQDMGKIVAALHRSKIDGTADIGNGINVAQLALKHRQNKNQRQRIIVFIGSPVADTEEELVKLGKKLKKNNVAVDVVNFGEDEANEDKLAKFVDAVNSGENSHLLTIPAGPQLLSDIILSSPILMEEGESGAGPSGSGGGGSSNNFEFGVDPSMDPELAMALRMSLEEEQARQRAAEGASGSSGATAPTTTTTTTTTTEAAPSSSLPSAGSMVLPGADAITGAGAAADDEAEDEELKRALALSAAGNDDVDMADAPATSASHTNQGNNDGATSQLQPTATVAGEDGDEEMDEEEAIARAIQMSLESDGHRDKQK